VSADLDTRCGSYAPSAEVLPSERSDAGAATFASDGSLPADCAEAFARSNELYGSLKQWLCGPQAGGLTHAELEERLAADGRELLRQLYQDSIDLRAVREQRVEQVVGADGVRRASAEPGHERTLQSVFGDVRVGRIAYRARGHSNLYPADDALNLPEEKQSHGLRRLAAIESTRGSFSGASEAILRSTGQGVANRQSVASENQCRTLVRFHEMDASVEQGNRSAGGCAARRTEVSAPVSRRTRPDREHESGRSQ